MFLLVGLGFMVVMACCEKFGVCLLTTWWVLNCIYCYRIGRFFVLAFLCCCRLVMFFIVTAHNMSLIILMMIKLLVLLPTTTPMTRHGIFGYLGALNHHRPRMFLLSISPYLLSIVILLGKLELLSIYIEHWPIIIFIPLITKNLIDCLYLGL